MTEFAKDTKASVIACLRYRDAPAAIEWLCKSFGLRSAVTPYDGCFGGRNRWDLTCNSQAAWRPAVWIDRRPNFSVVY